VFVTGAVPEPAVLHADSLDDGKVRQEVYTIAADYNFGQISAEWVRMIVKERAAPCGEEFIPLSVSQFSQTIQNIQ